MGLRIKMYRNRLPKSNKKAVRAGLMLSIINNQKAYTVSPKSRSSLIKTLGVTEEKVKYIVENDQ